MKKQNRLKVVIFLIVAMFMFLVLYLAYFQIAKSEELASNPNNPRIWIDESEYKRGSIKASGGEVLAESVLDENGEYERVYNYGQLFSHITGYSSIDYGKTGIEQSFNHQLLELKAETPIDEIRNKLIDDSQGNNVVLTLNFELQEKAAELLQGHKGSIIVMDVKTGDIYAMFSNPTFDANTVDENWDTLINDPDSALLNRSSQGLYTPGSVIKIITAVAIMESGIDLNYYDNGSTTVEGYTINNFENQAYGEIDLELALAYSSNTYFVDKGLEVGVEKMDEVFNKLLLGSKIDLEIPTEASYEPFEENMDTNEFAAAVYGQGNTLVTPLQMTMCVAAIGNDGKMVQPRLVKEIEDPDNNTTNTINDDIQVLSTVTDEETAEELTGYMGTVVDYYTSATTYNTSSGGKTGTAETASGLSHAWYVGLAPLEEPRFAVGVILEEDGTLGGRTAAPIGAQMLDAATMLVD